MKLSKYVNLVHWVAIFAILMSALAPTLSHAVSQKSVGSSFDTEICSVDGVKIIHVNGNDSAPSEHVSSSKHCPYCAVQLHYLPSLKADLHFNFSTYRQEFPPLFLHSPKPLFAWLTLPSRAPPVVS